MRHRGSSLRAVHCEFGNVFTMLHAVVLADRAMVKMTKRVGGGHSPLFDGRKFMHTTGAALAAKLHDALVGDALDGEKKKTQ